jgi:hypothetical protein
MQMSRSRRRTPIFSVTTAKSDHAWKVKAARTLRHVAKITLERDHEGFAMAGKRWDAVNPWSAPKDSKRFVGSAPQAWLRK